MNHTLRPQPERVGTALVGKIALVTGAASGIGEATALEHARDGIRVNLIHPALVKTPMWQGMDFWKKLKRKHRSAEKVWKVLSEDSPMGRFAKPEEVASCIAFLVSDESSYVSGSELVIDGGGGS